MSLKSIDAKMVAKMFLAAASRLNSTKEWINELNVFPVPDGDTGTNMSMTILAAAKEVAALPEECDMDMVCKAIAGGSLRGARGNSGVILSQLLRGFTKVLQEARSIDAKTLSHSFKKGVESAYKAVMKPKEGTILTVAKAISEKAAELVEDGDAADISLEDFVKAVLEYGEYVLSKTPDMLPVLKQAGVVDSGGQGLIQVVKGAYEYLSGKMSDEEFCLELTETSGESRTVNNVYEGEADIKFGYCTEFIIMTERAFGDNEEREFKAFLESIGDSIVCVADGGIVKVHVHTNDPGLAIQQGLKFGQLTSMKIDNMRQEHHERVIKSEELKKAAGKDNISGEKAKYGFVSVSAGEGLDEIFKALGVDLCIKGGQTMNPSTEDMLLAVGKINAETVYIFPNNKNIILAANQAKELCGDKEIVVIPTKTVPQGISALISFMPEMGAEENKAAMTEAAQNVKTGQVTYAVRDTSIDGYEIHEKDIMGIGDGSILAVGHDIVGTTFDMVSKMADSMTEIITVYAGNGVNDSVSDSLMEKLEEAYPDAEVSLEYGGQPVYYYIVSVE